jgi:3-hydroxyisobutyrate dehydrogenase-like beta-hydroxyacid dehydrogenase
MKLPLGLKDVRFALDAGHALGVPLPIAEVLREHFQAAIAEGKGELDWSAIARLAAERAGL